MITNRNDFNTKINKYCIISTVRPIGKPRGKGFTNLSCGNIVNYMPFQLSHCNTVLVI